MKYLKKIGWLIIAIPAVISILFYIAMGYIGYNIKNKKEGKPMGFSE